MATAHAADHSQDFPVRMLGLRSLRDENFMQCRVETSVAHARKITDFVLKNGPITEPIVVFDDGKNPFYTADGIHRIIGYRAAARVEKRFSQIRAEIRPGTRDDAIIYAAGANQEKTYLKRKPEDIRNAAFKLLEIEGWIGKSLRTIASHLGLTNVRNIARWRMEYSEINQIAIPSEIVCSDGLHMPSKGSRRHTLENLPRPKRRKGQNSFRTKIGGIEYSLGTDEEEAKRKAFDLLTRFEERRSLQANPAGEPANGHRIIDVVEARVDFGAGAPGFILVPEGFRPDDPDALLGQVVVIQPPGRWAIIGEIAGVRDHGTTTSLLIEDWPVDFPRPIIGWTLRVIKSQFLSTR